MSSHDVVSGSETPVSWTGKTVTVNPTMDTAIGLADIQVHTLINQNTMSVILLTKKPVWFVSLCF